MRDAFADEIFKLANEDLRIVLLSGDIGNRMFDRFKEKFPDRFYNCGVAEQNMITTAAGLAMTGLVPVVYTITSFLIYRPLEQIRIDIAYHGMPVILVGVGGGLAYASNGPTHHALEDLSVMRTVPGVDLVSAADAHEVRLGLRQLVERGNPSFLRIGKKKEPLVYQDLPDNWTVGKAQLMREDSEQVDITLLGHGTLMPQVLKAGEVLNEKGMRVRVINMHTLRPFDNEALEKAVSSSRSIFTIEEHSKLGALGSIVSEFLAESNYSRRPIFKRLGTEDSFLKRTTNTKDAREYTGLTAEKITQCIQQYLAHERGN